MGVVSDAVRARAKASFSVNLVVDNPLVRKYNHECNKSVGLRKSFQKYYPLFSPFILPRRKVFPNT